MLHWINMYMFLILCGSKDLLLNLQVTWKWKLTTTERLHPFLIAVFQVFTGFCNDQSSYCSFFSFFLCSVRWNCCPSSTTGCPVVRRHWTKTNDFSYCQRKLQILRWKTDAWAVSQSTLNVYLNKHLTFDLFILI